MRKITRIILTGAVFLMFPLLASTAPAMCDENCTSRCQHCQRICVFGRCTYQCTPPEPVCWQACLTAKALACAAQATQRNAPFHGNYCGWGNTDASYAASPTDALDAACKRHDRCWDDRWPMACSCDRTLAAEAAAVTVNGGVPTAVREKAANVSVFYSSAPCL